MAKKTVDQWFAEYGESHQHPTNKLVHWICVPVIFCSVLGFIWSIPVPEALRAAVPWFNWALATMALITAFYVRLSFPISAGMLFFMAMCYVLIAVIEYVLAWPVWQVCAVAFALAWVGQFIGHMIEGRKPSFLNDLVFLLIGPAWLLSSVYRKIGQPY